MRWYAMLTTSTRFYKILSDHKPAESCTPLGAKRRHPQQPLIQFRPPLDSLLVLRVGSEAGTQSFQTQRLRARAAGLLVVHDVEGYSCADLVDFMASYGVANVEKNLKYPLSDVRHAVGGVCSARPAHDHGIRNIFSCLWSGCGSQRMKPKLPLFTS